MSHWTDRAACAGLWPAFDLDFYQTLRVAPSEMRGVDAEHWVEMVEAFETPADAAAICVHCPVLAECRADADARWADREPMTCIAGGRRYEWKPFGKSEVGAA